MNKKTIGLALSAFLLLGASTTYAATSKTVQATYKSFKYTVNGFAFKAETKDQPVVINGKVYLPVSAAAEALKTTITVDKKGSINFGEKLNQTPIANEAISYDYGSGLTNQAGLVNLDGGNHKQVIKLARGSNRITLQPNGNYQTLVLYVKATDTDSVLEFKDGVKHVQLKKELFSKDELAQIEVNIAGIKTLEVSSNAQTLSQNSDTIIFPTSYYK